MNSIRALLCFAVDIYHLTLLISLNITIPQAYAEVNVRHSVMAYISLVA